MVKASDRGQGLTSGIDPSRLRLMKAGILSRELLHVVACPLAARSQDQYRIFTI